LKEAERAVSQDSVFYRRVRVVRDCFSQMKQASDNFLLQTKFPLKEVVCPSLPEGLISFDGLIGEEEWKKAGRTGLFVNSVTGEAGSVPTEVFLMRDGENLYLGWKAGLRKGQEVRAERDLSSQPVWWDDNLEAFFYGDTTWYQFIVTSKGILWEAKNGDASWESQGRVKTFVGEDFWSGELVIPIESLQGLLKPVPYANIVWRANFGRVYYDHPGDKPPSPGKKTDWKEELQMWNPVFEPAFNTPARAGIIRFP
ncbi:MAG: carbohydrate-binding family 9-like protein, partial [Candidatus Omnitrophica bacterium]|nr:carbohydrate-binding family 9-like protein [Candidatus Omnitrophota bacterium]